MIDSCCRDGDCGGARSLEAGVGVDNARRSYWRLKQASGAYRQLREELLSTPTFEAWLVGSRAKQEFSVDEHGVVPLDQHRASVSRR